MPLLAILVVITLAVAPVAEEFVFRGALLAGFRSRWNLGPSAAMVTVLFLAVHMIDILTHPASGISLALLALATLAARVITGSLGPAMALHAAYNLVIVVMLSRVRAARTPRARSRGPFLWGYRLIASAATLRFGSTCDFQPPSSMPWMARTISGGNWSQPGA